MAHTLLADPDVATALEFEREAEQHPDDRSMLLFEAAAAWQRADDPNRAAGILRDLTSSPDSFDVGHARVGLAEIHFVAGDEAAAYDELETVRRTRPPLPAVCAQAGELLEELDRPEEALRWFNIATAQLSEADLERIAESANFFAAGAHELTGRRRLRQRLGFPPDHMDRVSDALVARGRALLQPLGFQDPGGVEVRGGLVRMLVWPRGELERAHTAWPRVIPPVEGYHRETEARLRKLSSRGAAAIVLVPAQFEGMAEHARRVGGQITDDDVRWSHLQSQAELGKMINWPPPRNAVCWCGSARKYKKCCGHRRD